MESKEKIIRNGIIIVDKPAGFTSHDVVAKLRGIMGQRRIGHGGTLDPMATGVLPVFLGGACRASEYASAEGKEYLAAFRLGLATDTQDITGTVVSEREVNAGAADVEAALAAFRGEIMQTPPMYSAVQVGGVRLYDLARKGMEVERPARRVYIERLTLEAADEGRNEYTVRVACSKGTYVRTLCADIGERLGCGAALTSLRRTRSGVFTLADARTLDDFQRLREAGALDTVLLPVERLFEGLPRVAVEGRREFLLRHGACVPVFSGVPEEGLFRVYGAGDAFLMLGAVRADKEGRPAIFCEKNFCTAE